MKEIYLGSLYGYNIILQDVPDERSEHIRDLANRYFENMHKAYTERNYRQTELETARIINSLRPVKY